MFMVESFETREKISFKSRVGGLVKSFLYGNMSPVISEPILPFDIRYALEFKGAQLGPTEIRTLVRSNLTDITTYCLLKATENNVPLQHSFLQRFVDIVRDEPEGMFHLTQLQRQTVEELGENLKPIQGAKVAQIIRQGSNLWEKKFREVAEAVKKDSDTIGVYIAYSAAMGLRQAVELLEGKILLMIPGWINEPVNPNCGYQIDLGNPPGSRVQILPRNFQRPDKFKIIDDTIRNGISGQLMWDFWTGNQGKPISADKFAIIDSAPQNRPL